MTGSEPLSLEEEIKMQLSWRDDNDKCTFIVLARDACSCDGLIDAAMEEGDRNENDCSSQYVICNDDNDDNNEGFDFVKETLNAMIGDVNLFLSEIHDDDDDDDNDGEEVVNEQNQVKRIQAELDVMIAEEKYRKMGMGKEASLIMMLYGAQNLGIERFLVKIKEDNTASRALFEKLGFKECNYAACFQEYELELKRESAEDMVTSIKQMYGKKILQRTIK